MWSFNVRSFRWGVLALILIPVIAQAAEPNFATAPQSPLQVARSREAATDSGPYDPTPERVSVPWISSGPTRTGDGKVQAAVDLSPGAP
jgi:hypothetical protein